MKNQIQSKLELFAENVRIIKPEFKWHDASAKRLATMMYALNGRKIDCVAIGGSHDLIKSSTGVFSTFRGNMALCIAAMLSLKENREELFARTASVYEAMKKVKFKASDYLAVAAYEIASQSEKIDYHVARAREFYDGMKANSSWLRVGEDDYIYAAMLGLTDIDVSTGTDRVAQLYQRFQSEFRPKNCVQALAQVLVLSGDCDMVAGRVLALRDALKTRKIRLDKAYTLPSLGVLALLPVDTETLVQEIDEAQNFLKTQKGFGSWSVSKQELQLLTAAVVSGAYADDIKCGVITASVSTSIASIIIAQQAAIMAAVVASTVAASAVSTTASS